MKIALISFTSSGAKTCREIETGLKTLGYECSAYRKGASALEAGIKPLGVPLGEWTKDAFSSNDALIFVGACGIAVRAIAPHIRDKTTDPAVVVVDETGKYAISLLSGHLGGANDLTWDIAGMIGAEPVVTTATDLNHKFAVDEWAKKNNLRIGDMKLAKEISAAILSGEMIGVSSDYTIAGQIPDQLQMIPVTEPMQCSKTICEGEPGNEPEKQFRIGFKVSIYEEESPFEKTLHLFPRTVTAGIGCRKGTPLEAVEELFYKVLKEQKISVNSVEKICSIDIKKEEAALKQLAQKLGVPFEVFPAEELEKLSGVFTPSEFVNKTTGVDNVCERAAVLGSRGELIVKKQALNGVTAALAIRTEKLQPIIDWAITV